MESESTKTNRLTKRQFVGVVAAMTLIGGFILLMVTYRNNQSAERSQAEIETIPTLPEYPQSQPPQQPRSVRPPASTRETVVLVPRTETEVNCVLGGGGAACFDENYRPNYPTTSNQQEWEEWERNQEQNENLIERLF